VALLALLLKLGAEDPVGTIRDEKGQIKARQSTSISIIEPSNQGTEDRAQDEEQICSSRKRYI
jgi:hypothetical protein